MKKVVITYGTFDLFHVGHVRVLKRLKELGDELIVGVSTDEFNHNKGKKSFFTYEDRSEIVAACKYVDHVIPECDWDQKELDIKKYGVSIFGIGDDWRGKFDFLKDHCEVYYLERTEFVSTTDIKKSLSSIDNDEISDLENKLHSAIQIVKSLSSFSSSN